MYHSYSFDVQVYVRNERKRWENAYLETKASEPMWPN